MKQITLALLMLAIASTGVAQTKKAGVKKQPAKTASVPVVEASALNAPTAGKYAKDLGQKMFNNTNFEPRKGNYSLSINRWKPFKLEKEDGTLAEWYIIDVTIRWQSAQNGWPTTWTDVEYNGFIVCDEFGCEPNLLITTKKEPSSKGLAALVVKHSPVGELDDQHKNGLTMMDGWLKGVNYVWNPGGCLD